MPAVHPSAIPTLAQLPASSSSSGRRSSLQAPSTSTISIFSCAQNDPPKYALLKPSPSLISSIFAPKHSLHPSQTPPSTLHSIDKPLASAAQRLVLGPGTNLTLLLRPTPLADPAAASSQLLATTLHLAAKPLFAHLEAASSAPPSAIPVAKSKLPLLRPSTPLGRRQSLDQPSSLSHTLQSSEIRVAYCQLPADPHLPGAAPCDLLPPLPSAAAPAGPRPVASYTGLQNLLASAAPPLPLAGPVILTLTVAPRPNGPPPPAALLPSTLTLVDTARASPADTQGLAAVLAHLAETAAGRACSNSTPYHTANLTQVLRPALSLKSTSIFIITDPATLTSNPHYSRSQLSRLNSATPISRVSSVSSSQTTAFSSASETEDDYDDPDQDTSMLLSPVPGSSSSSFTASTSVKSQQLLSRVKLLQEELNVSKHHHLSPQKEYSYVTQKIPMLSPPADNHHSSTALSEPTDDLADVSMGSTSSSSHNTSTASRSSSNTRRRRRKSSTSSTARSLHTSILIPATSAYTACCHADHDHAGNRVQLLECVVHDYEEAIVSVQSRNADLVCANVKLQSEIDERTHELREMHDMNADLLTLVEEYEAHVTALIEIDAHAQHPASVQPQTPHTHVSASPSSTETFLLDPKDNFQMAARMARLEEELEQQRNEVKMLRLAQKQHASEAQFLTQRYNASCLENDELRAENERLAQQPDAANPPPHVVLQESQSTHTNLPQSDESPRKRAELASTLSQLTGGAGLPTSASSDSASPTKRANTHKRISSMSFFQYRPMTLTKRAMADSSTGYYYPTKNSPVKRTISSTSSGTTSSDEDSMRENVAPTDQQQKTLAQELDDTSF